LAFTFFYFEQLYSLHRKTTNSNIGHNKHYV